MGEGTLKLTTEQLDQWEAALRSGEYKQCQGYWRLEDGYCCLSVLGEGSLGLKSFHGTGLKPEEEAFIDTVSEFLSSALDVSLAHFYYLNDHLRLSFSEIADKIKELRRDK